ncbi:non-ribosomal peptide synthetase [Pseudonocardia sp. Ae168_Ps1]|uniref:non-ribosomal peptide synthetase n=1 Tax=unclassified Pseudonocardia TaxID=2619320 RepID=UPI000969C06B|nr:MULTISPECIES: amino acid adenylation domain-containing protein [unclassified Pseudonocardia]OLL74406.1 non-ribosomal peptide synthetase [Pseudonocardia sp. Ae150A_Ps1]OLL80385.1 non-ribosomal peptide synthetase [Pseudonocardia sp. Ae168_Ps1]OLL85487.1 non-ribosomal peptide synthetase [Pseudonocardia sp. Ae263_Ps1]OLL94486.1 non-ribosomal peptide synthetase [Pseudonocardia sp. Ae356_Ps1]
MTTRPALPTPPGRPAPPVIPGTAPPASALPVPPAATPDGPGPAAPPSPPSGTRAPATRIPRWTTDPVPGTGVADVALPTDGPVGPAALLAAHARVLAALSGETGIVTGVRGAAGAAPVARRLDTTAGSWRDLVEAAGENPTVPEDAGFETVLDPYGDPGDPTGDVVLTVGVVTGSDGPLLRLRFRTDVADAGFAARIAGYHLTALAALTAEPDAAPARRSLLADDELHHQLTERDGPDRELPDARFHELVERRVAAHPDAVAAELGDVRWTYRELNTRANRLARALLDRGLAPEDPVAVVTERNLGWMASVLAVFKAGGAYLPIEPHFPSERIATTLSRAGCRLVLTERGSTTNLDGALATLPGSGTVGTVDIDDPALDALPGTDPGLEIGPDRLAYLYFTSGSTGVPKGAMCEHAGMLNHLFAKIEDLGVGEGQAVAQTAPQCFDISLWQLMAALLVGGRTVIVEQELILDVARYTDRLADARVDVVQVVPSYLEVVLSYLDANPRDLPDLHTVSTTGEALKPELAARWFAARPGVRIANAYGLTETSDDITHAVLDRLPAHGRVPLGLPVRNTAVRVVDDDLVPVPLGAPGEIVCSGVCVGRGYVGDPERTRQVFTTDPYRPGQRLYRSGDHGRWLPDGTLEFLGRRDTQVKIRGFRIEIGEIENTLARVPGVRDAAVVVAERAGGNKHLVAFYASGAPIEDVLLRERLAASLPGYMVPSVFHHRDALPLTANSKVDTKALAAIAAETDAGDTAGPGDGHEPPQGPTEQRIAGVVARVLDLPPDGIDRRDHFFDLGGTSLSAVKVVIGLDRVVSLADITRHPVLADLAAVVDGRVEAPTGLLLPLLDDPSATGLLVCFPYAGGNAVSYRPMAAELRGSGLAVHAVELPGHDLDAAEPRPFAELGDVAARVADEIVALAPGRVLLWGHSAGAAFALETTRALETRGTAVDRVFAGAQLPGSPAARRAAVAALTSLDDVEVAAGPVAAGGHPGLGGLDAPRAARVGAAYRHDHRSANLLLAELLEDPPAGPVAAPVTVVVAADDPSTTGYPDLYDGWAALAGPVELVELPGGGHHFLRTRPADAARAVTAHPAS